MANIEFGGVDNYLQMLARLGDKHDEVMKKVVDSGARVLYQKIKGANAKFAKYVKFKGGKKNQYGWFAQVQFKGKTESGASAGLALGVYEYGRGGYKPQPARPWLKATIAAAEQETLEAMSDTYDEEAAKIGTE